MVRQTQVCAMLQRRTQTCNGSPENTEEITGKKKKRGGGAGESQITTYQQKKKI